MSIILDYFNTSEKGAYHCWIYRRKEEYSRYESKIIMTLSVADNWGEESSVATCSTKGGQSLEGINIFNRKYFHYEVF